MRATLSPPSGRFAPLHIPLGPHLAKRSLRTDPRHLEEAPALGGGRALGLLLRADHHSPFCFGVDSSDCQARKGQAGASLGLRGRGQ